MTSEKKRTGNEVASILTFNDMTFDECRFFWASGLKDYLDVSSKLLAGRLGDVSGDGFHVRFYSPQQLNALESMISDVLTLVETERVLLLAKDGTRKAIRRTSSNTARIRVRTVQEVHKSFLSPENAKSLQANLYLARWHSKVRTLLKGAKTNKEQFKAKLKSSDLPLASKKTFASVPGNKKVTYTMLKLSENETRGIALVYMIELLWQNMRKFINKKSPNPDELATIMRLTLQIPALLADSIQALDNSLAGKSGTKITPALKEYVQNALKADPKLDTKLLAKRALRNFNETAEQEGEAPSVRSLEEFIRRERKNLPGTGSRKT